MDLMDHAVSTNGAIRASAAAVTKRRTGLQLVAGLPRCKGSMRQVSLHLCAHLPSAPTQWWGVQVTAYRFVGH